MSSKKRSFTNHFLEETIDRRLLQSGLMLTFILVGGSIGYHLLEGMSLFEGLFQTFITITTIGFSELNQPNNATRVLTMVVALTGIGTVTYIGTQFFQKLFDSDVLLMRAMASKRRKMNQHYIVCGYGRIGHRISDVLVESGIQVIVIDNREEIIEQLKSDGVMYVFGDASEDNTLYDAGIERAKGLVCALSKDQDNIFTTLLARELNPDIFIMARTNEARNQKRIIRAGADKVISPYEIGSDHMSNVLLRPKWCILSTP